MAKDTAKGDDRKLPGSKWELPSGSWRIQFYINGQSHHETHRTVEAAVARLEEIARLKDAHIDVAGGLQTVRDYYAGWLEQRARSSKAGRTKAADVANVNAYIIPAIGDERMADVRGPRLQQLLNDVEDDVKARTQGHRSGRRTAQLVGTLLKQAFRDAHSLRLIPFDPMDGVKIPTYTRAEVEPADDVKVAALLLRAAAMPHPALWFCYALLGLRRNEGLGIRIKDVDLRNRTILIAQQVQRDGKGWAFPLPKGGKTRLLPYPAIMDPWIEQAITAARKAQLKAGPAWRDHGLLFPSETGAPIWPTTVDHWWHELRAAVELPPALTLHSLRHAFMTMLDEASITEAQKQRIMGHAKKNVTHRYTHPAVQAMRRAIEEVAQRVVREMMQATPRTNDSRVANGST